MPDSHELDRRKNDGRFDSFMGEIHEWKKQSIEWRVETDKSLKEIKEFMDEIRAPRKLIVWTIRAVVVAAIGSVAAAFVGFLRGHVKWG